MEYGMTVGGEIYEAGNDEERKFPEEFREYVQKENLLCRMYWESLFETNFCVFKIFPDDGVTSECLRLVDMLISFFKRDHFRMWNFLVQFWAAEEVLNSVDEISHINYRLTTRNKSFLLGDITLLKPNNEGLCHYQMKTCDVIVTGDGGGGAIRRALRNKRIEYTPDVGYYSSEEYHLRDVALSCDIKNSIVVPWFDSYRKVVGVIEFVSPWNPLSFAKVLEYFDTSFSLERVDRCQGLCAQDLEKDLLIRALSEIKKAVGVVFESHIIIFARTWMLCKSCNSISNCKYFPELSASRRGYFGTHNLLKEAGSSCILQKGEGVVGKAVESSHNLVYCENVAKFSIIQYPLAHFARRCNLSACFALCLRSNYTGDQVYILEFFLSPGHVRGVDLRTMLVSILDQMKQDFQTFKVAFGREELGDRLHVLVTDANSPEKLETLKSTKLNLTLTLGINNVEGLHLLKKFKRNGGLGESSRQSFIKRLTGESSKSKTDDSMIGLETSIQDTSMEDVPIVSDSTVQSEFHVTIKANYGEDRFIRFQLSASSGINELYHQLSQRLELVDGTYNLKYLDEENDLIELTCDDDLQLFISNSVIHEISTLMVLIVPK